MRTGCQRHHHLSAVIALAIALTGCGRDAAVDEGDRASSSAAPATAAGDAATTTNAPTHEPDSPYSTGTTDDQDEPAEKAFDHGPGGKAPSQSKRDADRRRTTVRKRQSAPTPRKRSTVSARDRFITAADANCLKYLDAEAEAREKNDGSKERQLEYLDKVALLLNNTVIRFHRLSPPRADRPAVNAYVSKIAELRLDVLAFRDKVAHNDPDYQSTAKAMADASAEAKKMAKAFGFKVCGSR